MSDIEYNYQHENGIQFFNAIDYINSIFEGFIELHGDRLYGDDPSLLGGIALLEDMPVTVIAQLSGKTLEEQVKYNFSMTCPEGFRKAVRLMKQAEKFGRPIICFIDTVGAYPGVEAEARGQACAISNSIMGMLSLRTPIVSVIIGNGCSGGALALSAADRIVMLENAMFTVISPKAYSEITWRDQSRVNEAMSSLTTPVNELVRMGIVDKVIYNRNGENYLNYCSNSIKKYIYAELKILKKKKISKLVEQRCEKYRKVGGKK